MERIEYALWRHINSGDVYAVAIHVISTDYHYLANVIACSDALHYREWMHCDDPSEVEMAPINGLVNDDYERVEFTQTA